MRNLHMGPRILLLLVLPTLACSGLAGATPTVWAIQPWVDVTSVPAPATSAPAPKPTFAIPTSWTTGDPYIDQVVSFAPGNPVNPAFGNTLDVLGAPDANLDALTGFLNLGIGGVILVKFVNNQAFDGPGADIEIYGDPMNDEQWIVEASADCSTYKSFGQVSERASLDLATVGLASARCIRITDKGRGGAGATSPGTELDAIEALHSSVP